MSLSREKILIIVCVFFVLLTFFAVERSGILKMTFKVRPSLRDIGNSSDPRIKALNWRICKGLISGKDKVYDNSNKKNDHEIFDSYNTSDGDCARVLQTRFPHPLVTIEEQRLPVAFAFIVYKDAHLFERILQAMYMPNNVYCIHIDKKSPEIFRRAIEAMTRCLRNVFISANTTDVFWGHFSVVQAQINCMEELLQSSMKWKYYISLTGQDFPLYDNGEIVRALQGLGNFNSMESFPMPENNRQRIEFVYRLQNNFHYKTQVAKSLPPDNITIYKGSTHIVAIREFVEFVLHSKIGQDFIEFLNDTHVPDETLYATLQQHPLAPGGILGEQPEYISRALQWHGPNSECHGKWVRSLCWMSIEDLRWALGPVMRNKLFAHKIPYDFNDELLECLLVARQGRKYGTTVWR